MRCGSDSFVDRHKAIVNSGIGLRKGLHQLRSTQLFNGHIGLGEISLQADEGCPRFFCCPQLQIEDESLVPGSRTDHNDQICRVYRCGGSERIDRQDDAFPRHDTPYRKQSGVKSFSAEARQKIPLFASKVSTSDHDRLVFSPREALCDHPERVFPGGLDPLGALTQKRRSDSLCLGDGVPSVASLRAKNTLLASW